MTYAVSYEGIIGFEAIKKAAQFEKTLTELEGRVNRTPQCPMWYREVQNKIKERIADQKFLEKIDEIAQQAITAQLYTPSEIFNLIEKDEESKTNTEQSQPKRYDEITPDNLKVGGGAGLNSLIDDAFWVLQEAESIRFVLENQIDELQSLSGTAQLENPSLIEDIRVLFWTISSNMEGDIQQTGIQDWINRWSDNIVSEWAISVFVPEAKELSYAVKRIFSELRHKNIEEVRADLQETVQKFKNFTSDSTPDENTENMKFKIEYLEKVIGKLTSLKPIFEKYGSYVNNPEFKTELLQMVSASDEIGKKAHSDWIYKPKDIFKLYHPEAKLKKSKI